MRYHKSALIALLGITCSQARAQIQFSDDFNRADNSTLGANYTTLGGSIGIVAGAASVSTPDFNLVQVNGVNVPYTQARLSIDAPLLLPGTSYVALVFGIQDVDHNLFVKVQQNSDSGLYDHAAFYYGDNGNFQGIVTPFGLGFFRFDNPFDSARITTYALDADTIRLGIDTNFDGVFDQVFDSTGASQLALGGGVGFGMYAQNSNSADNFVVGTAAATPEPGSLAFLASLGLTGAAFRERRRNQAHKSD